MPSAISSVVYWLGAGASANALPIVGEMPSAFRRQASILMDLEGDDRFIYLRKYGLEDYAKYLRKMALWSEQYGTIDTYARALYLLDDQNELARLKMHLGMFFMLNTALYKRSKPPSEAQHSYWKRDLVDTRYMGWLALMLNPKAPMNPRVKIISWNYDLQIEHALSLYKGYSEISGIHEDDSVKLFPAITERDDTRLPDVVRLNGIAGHAQIDSRSKALYAGMKNSINNENNFIESLFVEYSDSLTPDGKFLRCMIDTLNFAWEKKDISLQAMRLAINAMQMADILVVIGYSFPTFNRSTDKLLYQAFARDHKTVVLQNRSISPETFKAMMSNTIDNPRVIQEMNLDQFYVPSELF